MIGTNEQLEAALDAFRDTHKVNTKGKLALVLFVSRRARQLGLPLDAHQMLTTNRGQVHGLGKAAVQAILADYGITRVLAEEAGRTSRGSIGLMVTYVAALNALEVGEPALLAAVEAYWANRVRLYFSSKPFVVRCDLNRCIRAVVRDLLAQAARRQQEAGGTMYLGAVLQHLIGAKLETMAPGRIHHHGASVADDPGERSGDFLLEDVVIHVTTAPGEAVVRKCKANIDSGKRPIIVTLTDKIGVAVGLAQNAGLEERIDVIDAEQFLATNVYEWSKFRADARRATLGRLVEAYNKIIGECETDPSLRLALA